jgi:single-stranded-DNA-specific exonuclease
LEYNWKFHSPNQKILNEYVKNGVNPLIARIAAIRGLDYKDYEAIFDQNSANQIYTYCDQIVGLNAAANLLLRSILSRNVKVFIFCDYDTDGMTSAAITKIVCDAIQNYYFKGRESEINRIDVTLPNRKDGYGINLVWAQEIVKKFNNEKDSDIKYLVVTYDNGITAAETIKYLKKNGIDTIVTDHHEPNGEIPIGIVVDPKKDEEKFGQELCGAGIAFLVAVQMYRFLLERLKEDTNSINNYLAIPIQKAMIYAAIGTVGDMMPMTPFNMVLTNKGLEHLNRSSRRYEVPIDYLKNKFREILDVTSRDIGFNLGAALNACGQMEDSQAGYNLLVSTDPKEMKEAALTVYKYYEQSRALTKSAKAELNEELQTGIFDDDKFCIHTMPAETPSGIVGKLAQHITQLTGKPAVVLVDGENNEIRGSGRCSNYSVDILKLLRPCVEGNLIKSVNGHKTACGVIFYKDKIEELQEYLNNTITDCVKRGKIISSPVSTLLIDDTINIKDFNVNFYRELNCFPYSQGFSAPIFLLEGFITGRQESKNNPNNVKYTIQDFNSTKEIDIWTWNIKPDQYIKDLHTKIKLVGKFVRNFQDPRSFTLDVIDLKFE